MLRVRQRQGSTWAPSSSARASVARKFSSTPGSIPSAAPVRSSGKPSRSPSRRSAVGRRTSSGNSSDVASHGSRPTMAEKSSAASVTSRVSGPAWSSDDAKAIIP